MKRFIVSLFISVQLFFLSGCTEVITTEEIASDNDEVIYELPKDLSFAERNFENSYKRYLKRNSDNWEEDWQFHLKHRYYQEHTHGCSGSHYHSDDNETEQYKIDAGIVDFNMFY